VGDRTDPAQNLRGGTHYLRDLLDLFDGDLVLALAGYNAGENAVLRHGRAVPPYAETREYVRRVQDFYARYQQEGLPAPAPARAAEAARPPRAARLQWERGG
jgi:soluble lytic murein transglycosylase-like protein